VDHETPATPQQPQEPIGIPQILLIVPERKGLMK
jgi:hypothetical protein